MGLIAAGIAVAAVGAGASAYGSSKQASAAKDAAKYAAMLEKKFAEESQKKLDTLIEEKKQSALEINDLLDRYGGGPVAGSEENLELLRKTQNDFLRMAAGDFTAFEDQLKDIMASTVANTFGAGSPVGSFTQLSAQNIATLRQAGLATGAQVGQLLGGDSYNLLGIEYSNLDQAYAGYRDIEGRKVSAIGGYLQQAAQSAGANWQAGGSFLTSLGSAMVTGGVGAQNGSIPFLSNMMGGQNVTPTGMPASARPSYIYGGGGGGGGGYGYVPTTPTFLPTVGGSGAGLLPPADWSNPNPYSVANTFNPVTIPDILMANYGSANLNSYRAPFY